MRSILDELKKLAPQYSPQAYQFVMDALGFTVVQIGKRRHVSGRELSLGVRDLALDLWGPMARHVLSSWGIRSTDDIGEIVFVMIQAGLLSKTDEDTKEDFKNIYNFVEAFERQYEPEFDERGHVRRKVAPSSQPIPWLPFLGEQGVN